MKKSTFIFSALLMLSITVYVQLEVRANELYGHNLATFENRLNYQAEEVLSIFKDSLLDVDSTNVVVDVDSTNVVVDVDSTNVVVDVDSTNVVVDIDSTNVVVDIDSTNVVVDIDSTNVVVDIDSTNVVVDIDSTNVVVDIDSVGVDSLDGKVSIFGLGNGRKLYQYKFDDDIANGVWERLAETGIIDENVPCHPYCGQPLTMDHHKPNLPSHHMPPHAMHHESCPPMHHVPPHAMHHKPLHAAMFPLPHLKHYGFKSFDVLDNNNIVALVHSYYPCHNNTSGFYWNGERWIKLSKSMYHMYHKEKGMHDHHRRRSKISIAHDGSIFSIQRNKMYYFDTESLRWERIDISNSTNFDEIHNQHHRRYFYALDAFSKDEVYGITFWGNVVRWDGSNTVGVSKKRSIIHEISVGKDGSLWGYRYSHIPHLHGFTSIYELDKDSKQWVRKSDMRDIRDLEVFTENQIALVDGKGNAYLWDGVNEQIPLAKVDSNGHKIHIYQIAIGGYSDEIGTIIQSDTDTINESDSTSVRANFYSDNNFENYGDQYSITTALLYPVPVKNKLNIKLSKNIKNASIEIYSVTGKLVYKESDVSFKNGSCSISNLSSLPYGTYFLKIRHNFGVISKQIIKE